MNTISKPCYLSLLQISAIYFPAFEKADCTIFALLVVVSPFFFLLFYHRLEQKETMIRNRIRDLLCLWCSSFQFVKKFKQTCRRIWECKCIQFAQRIALGLHPWMHLHRRVAPNKNEMQKCKRMFYTVGTTLCNVYVLIQYVDWKTLFCDSFRNRVLGVKKKSVSFSYLYFFSNRNIRRY